MKAIVEKNGRLIHEQAGRRVTIWCPFGSQCGDWCALWQEIKDGARITNRGEPLGKPYFVRVDCRGNWHFYDEYEDQRDSAKAEEGET